MSFSLYIGIGFFICFALTILMWSICQYKNKKAIEEIIQSHSDMGDPRNGIFYIATQYSVGRGGLPYEYSYAPSRYEYSEYPERQNEYSADSPPNFNSISRSISPPAYETFFEIDLEIPPSYEECSKLGYT